MVYQVRVVVQVRPREACNTIEPADCNQLKYNVTQRFDTTGRCLAQFAAMNSSHPSPSRCAHQNPPREEKLRFAARARSPRSECEPSKLPIKNWISTSNCRTLVDHTSRTAMCTLCLEKPNLSYIILSSCIFAVKIDENRSKICSVITLHGVKTRHRILYKLSRTRK